MLGNSPAIEHSVKATANKGLMVSENKLVIYIEDKDKEYLYEEILKKIPSLSERSFKVISTDGKQNAIMVYDYIMMLNNQFKFIIIVDGDFDVILGKEKNLDINFIYLRKYNIENYYIDRVNIKNYAKGKLKKTDEDLETVFKYDLWYEDITRQLYDLFLLYAIACKYDIGIKTVGVGCGKSINQETGYINSNIYEEKKSEIINDLVRKGLDISLDNEISELNLKIEDIGISKGDIICGKYYLNSIECYIRKCCKCAGIRGIKLFKDDLIWSLATSLNVSQFEFIDQRILEYINR